MSYGDDFKSEKDVGNSNAENREHEPSMYARRSMPLPSNQQFRIEWSGADPIFVGYAPRNLAENVDGWIIYNMSWVSGNPVCKKTAYGDWTNRSSEVYG